MNFHEEEAKVLREIIKGVKNETIDSVKSFVLRPGETGFLAGSETYIANISEHSYRFDIAYRRLDE